MKNIDDRLTTPLVEERRTMRNRYPMRANQKQEFVLAFLRFAQYFDIRINWTILQVFTYLWQERTNKRIFNFQLGTYDTLSSRELRSTVDYLNEVARLVLVRKNSNNYGSTISIAYLETELQEAQEEELNTIFNDKVILEDTLKFCSTLPSAALNSMAIVHYAYKNFSREESRRYFNETGWSSTNSMVMRTNDLLNLVKIGLLTKEESQEFATSALLNTNEPVLTSVSSRKTKIKKRSASAERKKQMLIDNNDLSEKRRKINLIF